MHSLNKYWLCALFLTVVSTAHADFQTKTFTLCKGEFGSGCPTNIIQRISCSESETPIIERECTVIENQKPRVRAYEKSQVSVKNGDKCGYTVWKITCGTK